MLHQKWIVLSHRTITAQNTYITTIKNKIRRTYIVAFLRNLDVNFSFF